MKKEHPRQRGNKAAEHARLGCGSCGFAPVQTKQIRRDKCRAAKAEEKGGGYGNDTLRQNKAEDQRCKNTKDNADPCHYGCFRDRPPFHQGLLKKIPAEGCTKRVKLSAIRAYRRSHECHKKKRDKPWRIEMVYIERNDLIDISSRCIQGQFSRTAVKNHICERPYRERKTGYRKIKKGGERYRSINLLVRLYGHKTHA